MSPSEGVLFGDFSAGIDIRGFAHGNMVANNIIRGRARAAVAVDVFNGRIPSNTNLVLNRFDDFDASVADVIVGTGVSDTLILGQKGTINDHGSNTVIFAVPRQTEIQGIEALFKTGGIPRTRSRRNFGKVPR